MTRHRPTTGTSFLACCALAAGCGDAGETAGAGAVADAGRAGGIAVPLCSSHPPPELDYVLADAQPELVIASPELAERVRPLASARGIAFRLTGEIATSGSSSSTAARLPGARLSRPSCRPRSIR